MNLKKYSQKMNKDLKKYIDSIKEIAILDEIPEPDKNGRIRKPSREKGKVLWEGSERIGVHQFKFSDNLDAKRDECSLSGNPLIKNLIDILKESIKRGDLKEDFTLMDVFCGDASSLYFIRKHFPKSILIGLDIFKSKMWEKLTDNKDNLIQVDFFNLVKIEQQPVIDCLLTFNSYRGMHNASIVRSEFDGWVDNNFKFFITNLSSSISADMVKGEIFPTVRKARHGKSNWTGDNLIDYNGYILLFKCKDKK